MLFALTSSFFVTKSYYVVRHTPYSDLVSLRLLPCCGINLATHINSLAHSSIGTPSPYLRRAPTPCKRMVSETISSPFRAAFHLSLMVLVHYRSQKVFSLGT